MTAKYYQVFMMKEYEKMKFTAPLPTIVGMIAGKVVAKVTSLGFVLQSIDVAKHDFYVHEYRLLFNDLEIKVGAGGCTNRNIRVWLHISTPTIEKLKTLDETLSKEFEEAVKEIDQHVAPTQR